MGINMNTDIFTGKAEVYAKARPSYPTEAIDYIISLLPDDAVFADVGAGTGKLTILLADRHRFVYAVEPNPDMRERLTTDMSAYSKVKVIAGTAEATLLPDKCVDVITCAQALHWFDPESFRAECRRIGKPAGLVMAIYNSNLDRNDGDHHRQAIEQFFVNPAVREFPNPIDYTRERWLAYKTSRSYDPLPSDPRYDDHIAEMNAIFDHESVDGILRQEVITTVYSEAI
ncbi:MAG: class I SAM-dependent methyltransferase [Lachnospiraceae bacterium]|jgi:ubiquinone/menaquinone biosynthesis C-methylase UbiE|nr:class I SAM-dependent methyltransferase [Lachnospiraceae bacterium]